VAEPGAPAVCPPVPPGSPASPIRLAVVDGYEVVRVGVAALMGDPRLRIELVAEAPDTETLLRTHIRFDVVLLNAPPGPPADLAADVARLHGTHAAVLIYTDSSTDRSVRAAARAGAVGMVPKDSRGREMVAAIRAAAGAQVVPGAPQWAAALASGTDDPPQLSGREREALVLYVSGLPLKSVARRMNVSSYTAKEYLKRVRAKYADAGRPANTKLELHRRAAEDGLIHEL
jgi:two-component system uhpT operon response regulator UhpA